MMNSISIFVSIKRYIWCFFILSALHTLGAAETEITLGSNAAPLKVGADKINEAILVTEAADVPGIEITIDASLGKEAYALNVVSESEIVIKGGDATGAMYGAFELAEQVRFNGGFRGVEPKAESPTTDFRAIKFNLPWDSYRRNPSLQLHMDACQDLEFWESFLNMMAENRFNALTLWNLHPFPYMVTPKSFPEVSEGKEAEKAQWKAFYHSLFQMAQDRGIETYIVNWNIFVDEAVSEKYGHLEDNTDHHFWGDGEDSDIIRKYTRECVTQVIDEYPNLTGLGFSLGERMGGFTPEEREEWAIDVIVGGIEDASRKIKLIHRVPFSANKGSGGSTDKATEIMTREAMEAIDCVESPILVEIKFNWSHAHSSPKLVKVHGGSIDDTYWNPLPENYAITWMIRNEDFFALRWGVPDFIREHIALNSQEYVGGYFIGSECYIPAVDYFTKQDSGANWNWSFERQWAYYQQWGRLLYNPATEDDIFAKSYQERYGDAGEKIQQAYALASQMPLLHGSYFDVAWDFTLYSEGFMSKWNDEPTQHITLDRLIHTPTLDPAFINVADYVTMLNDGVEIPDTGITPIELAETLEQNADQSLGLIAGVVQADTLAMTYELADIKIWSELSRYFASKLRAGVAYELARTGSDAGQKTNALQHMESALGHWQQVVELSDPIYNEMPLVHLNGRKDDVYFHWSKAIPTIEADIQYIEDLTF